MPSSAPASLAAPEDDALHGNAPQPRCQGASLPLTAAQHTILSGSLTEGPNFAIPSYSAARKSPPSSSPYQLATSSSLQTTPEALAPHISPSHTISQLPEGVVAAPGPHSVSSSSAMSEAVAISQRGTGLLRRLSRGARGAQTKLSRRRPSVTQTTRDQSAGPVMLRRRSDSNRDMGESTMDVSDLDLDLREDDPIDDLGETISQESIPNALHIYKSPSVASSESGDLAGDGPTRSHILQQGMLLTKVNRKKSKKMMFRLDFDAAKICWDSSKHLYIDDIRDIRKGDDARHDREERRISEDEARRWFTIVYSDPAKQKGRHTKAMHLIAETEHALFLWTQALDFLSRSRIEFMQGLHADPEKALRDLWMVAMQKKFNGSEHREEEERVDMASVKQICRNLHIHCSDSALKELFSRNDVDHAKSLSFTQFQHLIASLQERKDLRFMFIRSLAPGEVELDMESFFRFLRENQGAHIESDLAHWTSVFNKYAQIGKPRHGNSSPGHSTGTCTVTMNHHGFQAYMTSTENMAVDPPKLRAVLDRPLNEYFISSSHNTYLSGRQVVGESGTEPYISALNKGCRCVEIDCWDGTDGEPIVTHGQTWTSSVPFIKVINVISEYAFRASDYPLILSLEVHCNNEQQAKMANIMKATFGSKLVLEPVQPGSTVLPSPDQLRNRILVKVKAPSAMLQTQTMSEKPPVRRARGMSSPFSRPTTVQPQPQHSYTVPLSSPPSMSPPDRAANFWPQPKSNFSSVTSATPPSSAEDSDHLESIVRRRDERKRSHTSKIIPDLGNLGVYFQGFSFDDFKAKEASNYNHIFSLSERKFDPITRDGSRKPELEKHNMQYLMRVYPHSLRVRSENFDPLKAWRRGVQMAAMNWQTYDLGMQINDAMFAGGTDRTGFVLKPADMRPSIATEGEKPNLYPYKKVKKLVKFTVEIISAQRLPLPPRPKETAADAPINPYVEIEMHCAEDKGSNVASGEGGLDASARSNGVSGIGSPVTKRTKVVANNGFDPSFNERVTMTLETKYPSLVFVRWTVYNSSNTEKVTNKVALGTFTAKLSSLRTGYRHLPLYDNNGEQFLMSTLFCRILKEDQVAVGEVTSPTASSGTPTSVTLHKSAGVYGSAPHERSSKQGFFRKAFTRTPSQRKKREMGRDCQV